MDANTATPQPEVKKSSKKWCLIVLIPIILVIAACGICLLAGWLRDLQSDGRLPFQRDTATPVPTPSPTPIAIQSQRLNSLLQEVPETGTAHVFGIIQWGEQNITRITRKSFILLIADYSNSETGELVDYPIEYDTETGEFAISNLPYGEYGIGATISLGSDFPSPGDYQGDVNFEVGQSDRERFPGVILYVREVIHLKSPGNNAEIRPEGYDVFEEDELTFDWDPVDNADHYRFCMNEFGPDMPYERANCETISKTEYTYSDLKPNSGEKYYVMWIDAFDQNGIRIGWLMTRYPHAYSWDYRFRIK